MSKNPPPEPKAPRDFNMSEFPHAHAIGLQILPEPDGALTVIVPYDERLIGDPATGVSHGGVVTTALDTGCGVAAMLRKGGGASVATLDLRIDYMRPSKPGMAIRARCECYRVTRSVAFARGVAYDDDISDPVATATGAFMIARPTEPEK